MTKAMYVHVPFCKDICAYCDFMRCRYYPPLADKWLCALEKELKEKQIDPVTTIYIGGGTPSALTLSQCERLLKLLSPYAKDVQEYTMEVNADSLSDEMIQVLKQYGVNRISMGAQTFDPVLLARISRIADKVMIQDRIMKLRNAGIDNISLDLMYGLPGQSLAMWKNDLTIAVQLPITHISLYSLTIEEHSQFGREGVQPCASDLEADMYDTAIEFLTQAGFEHYEISNFAKPTKRSLHNQMYWWYEDFYGIGCGASGKEGHVRYENTRNLHTYIELGAQRESIHLQPADERFEMVMMSLRLKEGISLHRFEERFQAALLEVYGDVIAQKIEQGLLVHEDGYVHTTRKGMLLLHEVLLDFLP